MFYSDAHLKQKIKRIKKVFDIHVFILDEKSLQVTVSNNVKVI